MMTINDLYWMLSRDKTPAEIKEKLFSSASDDIGRSFYSRCEVSVDFWRNFMVLLHYQ